LAGEGGVVERRQQAVDLGGVVLAGLAAERRILAREFGGLGEVDRSRRPAPARRGW